MQLFIDTNIFLSFYHFTSDDLEELKKLRVLLDQGRLQLLLPDQVVDEFRRNRDGKIADALKRLRAQNLALQFPPLAKEYPGYERLRDLQTQYQREHAKLMEAIFDDAGKQRFKADETIRDLFKAAKRIDSSPQILERARQRFDLGNPPGKRDSLGDSVNWEALLGAAEDADLCLVSGDNDYSSALDESTLHSFLLEEWKDRKGSDVVYYKRLSQFFAHQFPDIKLATELEKALLIKGLATSSAFAETHKIIAQLNRLADFTTPELNDIVKAAITNNQVYLIIDDRDIRASLEGLVTGREDEIDPSSLKELEQLFGEAGAERGAQEAE